jgi:hypothetical protein
MAANAMLKQAMFWPDSMLMLIDVVSLAMTA